MAASSRTLGIEGEAMGEVSVLSEFQRLKLFQAVVEFMSRCGVPESVIRDSFDAALADVQGSQRNRKAGRQEDLVITSQNLPAQLLRTWHRDARYLNGDAKPLALHLTLGRVNLSGAIRRIDPLADPSQVIRSMKAVGLVRRVSKNRYVPITEAAIVDKLHPLAVEHVTKLVNRLISTVSRNIDRDRRGLSLVDRHAYTVDLNPADRVAFAEFTRIHGMAYLESIDDWLEQRRVRRSPSSRGTVKGVAAGVYLFAYLGDGEQLSAAKARPPTRRVARAATKNPKASSRKRTSTTREVRA
jgi:hypothetical protein